MKKYFAILLSLIAVTQPSFGHHSFAVHFEGDSLVVVEGVVTKFRFTNPHGVLFFTALDENGDEVEWKAETNSPNMLRRRGWSSDSLKEGDHIVITGFPARNEPHYMRINNVAVEGGVELVAQGKAD